MSDEGAQRPDGMVVSDRSGADANCPAWETLPDSINLHEKFGDGSEGKEAGWLNKASFSHQSTTAGFEICDYICARETAGSIFTENISAKTMNR